MTVVSECSCTSSSSAPNHSMAQTEEIGQSDLCTACFVKKILFSAVLMSMEGTMQRDGCGSIAGPYWLGLRVHPCHSGVCLRCFRRHPRRDRYGSANHHCQHRGSAPDAWSIRRSFTRLPDGAYVPAVRIRYLSRVGVLARLFGQPPKNSDLTADRVTLRRQHAYPHLLI
jgi:hypothetical protein